ncbi:sugar phosphate isomerase/epimerase family protein [Roseibacillus persicicus]|uniref:sugar phosphate isomerase/epimerase family protein n=1 Tax=Roseibacillus persicicus TaxID=454148 RepID=UPI00280D4463|nr:sugar phosphate isomerase/epimerase [Roseibacillus persicicus]MDQ8189995.1 sugar phosphate isomerase/epimerase [Roseibacillus persicicus]
MIKLTGFADEAANEIEGQIRAIKTLGWSHLELRAINGQNITDIPEADFENVAEQLETHQIKVNALGSTICNWGKSILEPMDRDWEEIERAIPRMKALGTKHIRIMSYAVLRDRDARDQMVEERVDRLRRVVDRFAEEGLQALHENCANYGGMGWPFTMELLEKVPGLKLIFDTANPATTLDRTKPAPHPPQSSWEFYQQVREHIAHVHVKDGRFLRDNPESVFEDADYVWPGEGDGEVVKIVSDLHQTGYEGFLSIEPHLSVVFHDESLSASDQARFDSFIEYGKRMERILEQIKAPQTP